MLTFPYIDINIYLLVFISLAAGALSGFAGVGGAFIVTPALIILGMPANLAVGTTLAWVALNSIMSSLTHRRLGNVDLKLGLVMVIAAMSGSEVGVRILNMIRDAGLAEEVVLAISICLLISVGTYTLIECLTRKQKLDKLLASGATPSMTTSEISLPQKVQNIHLRPMIHLTTSGVTISLWILLVLGFLVGVLSGLIGVGGGFIMMPSLVYLIGIPSFVAVGTDLFQIVFPAAYGAIRHALSGNIMIVVAVIMLVISSIGTQFGARATRYVGGISIRFILAISILIAAIGIGFKLADSLLGNTIKWLDTGSIAITFGGMGLMLVMIATLFIAGFRHQHHKPIPGWMLSLITKED